MHKILAQNMQFNIFDIFARTGILATFASSFRNDQSTHWVLAINPVLARTQVAFNKQVSSGASFKCEKTSNYLTPTDSYLE